MTKVNCDRMDCANNINYICILNEVHFIESYGRSTDYVTEYYCEDYRISEQSRKEEASP